MADLWAPRAMFTSEHGQFSDSVRGFVEAQIAPYVDSWDEAAEMQRDLWREAGR